MARIAVIGCGNIGKRHCQALLLMEEGLDIFLIDPFVNFEDFTGSLGKKALECRVDFHYVEDIESLSAIDVAIVATGSEGRYEVLQRLEKSVHPQYIIAEKFLFQTSKEYTDALQLFESNNRLNNVWVNQWMPSVYAFRLLKRRIGKNAGELTMRVRGQNWGMCCNSVHYLALFDFITGDQSLLPGKSNFADGFASAKRKGYIELFGEVEVKGPRNSVLLLDARSEPYTDTRFADITGEVVYLDFVTPEVSYYTCMYENKLKVITKTSNAENEEIFIIPFQSERTNQAVQDILSKGACDLVPFARSTNHHLIMLEEFHYHLTRNCNFAGDKISIT